MGLRIWLEQYDQEKEKAIRQLFNKTMSLFTGDIGEANPEKQSHEDLGQLGANKVLKMLSDNSIFSAMEDDEGPLKATIGDNAIDTKSWLQQVSKQKSAGKPVANFTVGGLLNKMFGDEMAGRLISGDEDVVDTAQAQVPPQPPKDIPDPQMDPSQAMDPAQAMGPPGADQTGTQPQAGAGAVTPASRVPAPQAAFDPTMMPMQAHHTYPTAWDLFVERKENGLLRK
jgi:hypothetical protein